MDEVAQGVLVVEVHIDHRGYKPAALLNVEVLLRGIGVHVGGEADVGAGVGVELVYPVVEGEVLHPPMLGAAVVGDDVHNHLDALAVGLRHEFAVEGIAAEARVYLIVVRGGIAVVRLLGRIVEQQGGRPYSCGTEVGDVVEVVDDTLDVATMASEEGIAVGLVIGVGGRVVRGVAIGKAVGHEQIHHIGRGEAGALGRAFATCLQLVGVAELLALLGEYEVVGAGLCLGIDGDVDKQVVGALGLVYLGHLHTFTALDGEVVGGDVGAMNHQLQGCVHAGPPGERLHAVYGVAHGAVLPTPGSLELYRNLYLVARYRAGESEGVVVGADNLKLAMADACAQGRVAMLEGDEIAVEVGM